MMKKLLFFCISTFAMASEPSWYHNLPNHTPNSYMGYGSGASESEATNNALISISSQINTKIDSQITQNKAFKDGSYQKDIQIKSNQQTKSNLSDYDVVKMSYEDGAFYVAIAYENISSIDKFIKKIKAKVTKDEPQNSYIAKTYLAKELKHTLSNDINFGLLRKDKKWYLKYQDMLQVIDKNDFEKFFTNVTNENITITTNKKSNILYDGDQFYFEVNSKTDGFVTILSVYEDGTVTTLYKNIPIKKTKTAHIPNDKFESVLAAGILEKGSETFDMYVAIITKDKVQFDRFATANEDIETNERYKNFDELIGFLEDKTYTTLKVVTKPK